MATLPSNDGNAQFIIKFEMPAEYACDAGFESSIHLRGEHWDGDHTFPSSASIEGIWLRAADLVALRDHITQWLQQSTLVPDDLDADFRLARLPGQRLHLRFGPLPDIVSALNPIVTITFSAGSLKGELHFVTDQSCLALFARELASELSGSHKNPG